MQKSNFKCRTVTHNHKGQGSKVKVTELPYLTFPVIVLNKTIPELVMRQCFELIQWLYLYHVERQICLILDLLK